MIETRKEVLITYSVQSDKRWNIWTTKTVCLDLNKTPVGKWLKSISADNPLVKVDYVSPVFESEYETKCNPMSL